MKKPTGRKPYREGACLLKELPYKDEWRVDLTAHNPRLHRTFHNWRAAIEFAQAETKRREAAKAPGQRHTFDEAARGWIDRCRKSPDVGPDTFRQYAHLLEKYVLPYFGRRVFRDITSRDIEKWVYDQIEHAAYKSARHRLTVLNMILDYGANEWSGVNPLKIKAVIVPGKSPKRAKIPDRSDLEAIREFIRRPRRFDRNALKWSCTRVLVVLGASCGLRVGECAALRWDSIDRDTGEIDIREAIAPWAGVKGPKTEAGYRKVPTTPAVREILDEHAEIYKQTFGNHVGYVLRAKRWKSLGDKPRTCVQTTSIGTSTSSCVMRG